MAEYCNSFRFDEDNQEHFVVIPNEEDCFEINTGTPGPQGDPGEGVPRGGTTGQILKKKSNADYDTEWASGGGGVSVQSDWDQNDPTADDYIKNKPTIPAAQVNSDWTANSGVAQILHKPTLGTAAAKNVPASGDASTTEVVLGNDTRLTDARNAADVSAWAKAANKPSYNAGEVTYSDQAIYSSDTVGDEINGIKAALTQLDSDVDKLILMSDTATTIPSSGYVDTTLTGLTADHQLIRWNFVQSGTVKPENSPPCDLTWTTSANSFRINNDSSTTLSGWTCQPIFAIPN